MKQIREDIIFLKDFQVLLPNQNGDSWGSWSLTTTLESYYCLQGHQGLQRLLSVPRNLRSLVGSRTPCLAPSGTCVLFSAKPKVLILQKDGLPNLVNAFQEIISSEKFQKKSTNFTRN